MADKESKLKIEVGVEVDKNSVQEAIKTVKNIEKELSSSINNNGYIKLPAKVGKFKYPEQKMSKSGLPQGTDYSRLQKAQDELVSSWNKLSKRGFSSPDEDLVEVMKMFKKYQTEVRSHYSGTDDLKDNQVTAIRSTIGKTLRNYFTRLAPAPAGNGKLGSLLSVPATESEFERYAKNAIKKHRAATIAGVDLSKDSLTKEDIELINSKVKEVEQKDKIKEDLTKKLDEKKHAKKTIKNQEKQMKKIEKERESQYKNAIPLEKGKTEAVVLTTTEIDDTPKQKKERTKKDEKQDKRYFESIKSGASNRAANTPNNDTKLGNRQQIPDDTYFLKNFINMNDRLGSYFGRSSLQRQSYESEKEWAQSALDSLVKKIDKDGALAKLAEIEKPDRKEWNELSAQTGISKMILDNVALFQAALMKGVKEVTPDHLKAAINLAIMDGLENGKSQIPYENYKKAEIGLANMLQNRYSNLKSTLGVSYSDDGEEKGVGEFYEVVKVTLTDIFKEMQEAEDLVREHALTNPKFNEFYGKKDEIYRPYSNSVFEKMLKKQQEDLDKLLSENHGLSGIIENLLDKTTIEATSERVSDTKSLKASRKAINIAERDERSGLNADQHTLTLFGYLNLANELSVKMLEVLQSIFLLLSGKKDKGEDKSLLPDLYRSFKDGKWGPSEVQDKTDYSKRRLKTPSQEQWDKKYEQNKNSKLEAEVEKERAQIEKGEHPSQQRVSLDRSEVYASMDRTSDKIKKIFKEFFKKIGIDTEAEVDRIMNATSKELDLMRAKRVEIWGENRGRQLTDTGDIADVKRTKALFGWRSNKRSEDKQLFQDIKLTPGFNKDKAINTAAIERELNKVLSGPEMFKAQTGGVFRNLIGSMTGYIGMPSLEKSRAAAEGLNQVMADVRKEILGLIQDIQAKESTLAGMEQLGTAKFTTDGRITSDSSLSAQNTFTKLEEQKEVLRGALIEVKAMDNVIGKTNGKVSQIVKKIGFVMPELMQNNTIIHNINAGLDKNGKALKFQTRTAEMLNYSFQLLTRHIGQMFKNWMLQLNPLRQIQKLFKNFAGYDTKWQRTMNVIKFNIQRIFRPFMQWIAQQMVNLIGLANAFLNGIGKAFGKKWDLFDQSAANAEKMRQELEKAANVSAGFDELHDIGSDNSAENDLMGDIYKPQLSEGWIKAAETLGGIFAKIGKAIQSCMKHWKLFVGALAIFTVAKGLWKLLKWSKLLHGSFEGLTKIPWASIAKGLGWVATALAAVVSVKETFKLGFDWDKLDDKQKNKTIAGSIGFGTLAGGLAGGLIGGPAGAAIGAGIGAAITGGIDSVIADYNGDDARAEITAALGGAGLGATIGTLIAPGIGTAVGAALGSAFGWATEKLGHTIFSDGGEYSNLKISVSDLAWANEQLAAAQDKAMNSAYNLKQAEEQTGYSGKELYNSVQEGKLKIDDMTSSQILVYNAYKKHIGILQELKAAQQTQMDYETILDLERAKKTGNYSEYINKMMQANEDGIYSTEEMYDRFAQVYGELDGDSRKVFLDQLPETMRQSIELQGENYMSNWDKFTRDLSKNWDKLTESIGKSAKKAWENVTEFFTKIGTKIKETWENIKDFGKKTGEKFGNLMTGRGFKTNSEVSTASVMSVPAFATGTNYIPSDGLAYLHQGEAVIPKKYNKPYQSESLSTEEKVYMKQMITTMKSLDGTIKQGIPVSGQFTQRGSDLVAVVNRTKSQTGADLLSNVAYAR